MIRFYTDSCIPFSDTVAHIQTHTRGNGDDLCLNWIKNHQKIISPFTSHRIIILIYEYLNSLKFTRNFVSLFVRCLVWFSRSTFCVTQLAQKMYIVCGYSYSTVLWWFTAMNRNKKKMYRSSVICLSLLQVVLFFTAGFKCDRHTTICLVPTYIVYSIGK